MIMQMVVDFCLSLMLLWTLIVKAFAQFQKSERPPGLFQDFEDGYMKP